MLWSSPSEGLYTLRTFIHIGQSMLRIFYIFHCSFHLFVSCINYEREEWIWCYSNMFILFAILIPSKKILAHASRIQLNVLPHLTSIKKWSGLLNHHGIRRYSSPLTTHGGQQNALHQHKDVHVQIPRISGNML